MRKLLLFCFLCFFSIIAGAQDVQRHINFNPIDNDSLNMSLNSTYNLIEDSCAQIIRHTRINFRTRKFHGPFSDVSKQNPTVVLNEGNYSNEGLKDGTFIMRYPSGSTKAKGAFKKDVFDGRWDMFYESGKPQLSFEVKDGIYNIIDVWDRNGKKTIDKGNGNYTVDLTFFYWTGKLANGRPDGTWKMYGANNKNKEAAVTEHFKKGAFVDGESPLGKYTNESRISLVSTDEFKFFNAEKMYIGIPCNLPAIRDRVVVNAHYKSGITSFKIHLEEALKAYIIGRNLTEIEGSFFIVGDVDLTGHIVNLKKGGGYIANMERGVINIIESLPQLIPATIDDKPVVQQFKISLIVNRGGYSGSFEFLPIRYK